MEKRCANGRLGSKHVREPSLDYSPLAKSIHSFSADALVGSRDSHSGAAATPGSSGSHALNSDCIPAKHAPLHLSSSRPLERHVSAAPAGSAWNPWQGHSGAPPLPPRRPVSHKPNASWFSPVVGFGGPSNLIWEQQQRQAEELRQSQQQQQELATQRCESQLQHSLEHQASGPKSQLHHQGHGQVYQQVLQRPIGVAGQPVPQFSGVTAAAAAELAYAQPLGKEVAKLMQSSLNLGPTIQQPPDHHATPQPQLAVQQQEQEQRSLPWYKKGWQQAQPPMPGRQLHSRLSPAVASASAGLYPGGNPFANEAVLLKSTAVSKDVAMPTTGSGPPLHAAVQSSLAGDAAGTSARKLPPPPRFLLSGPSHPSLPDQQAHGTEERQQLGCSASGAAEAHKQLLGAALEPIAAQPIARQTARDVAPRPAMDQPTIAQLPQWQPQQGQGMAAVNSSKLEMQAWPAPPPRPQSHGLAATPRVCGMAAPPPPLPSRAAGRAPSQKKTGPSLPPPDPLPGAQGSKMLSTARVPPPPPPASLVAAKTAGSGPTVAATTADSAHAPPAAWSSSSPGIKKPTAAELQAAAGKLRKVGDNGRTGSGSAAAAVLPAASVVPEAARLPAGGDVRAQLMHAIKSGVKLRKVEERKEKEAAVPRPAGAGTPLGTPTAGMAELLRRVVERRRVDAGVDSGDSDSDWGA